MQLLRDVLKKNIAHKHLSQAMIGSIAVNAARHYFGYTMNTELLDGYVRFDKLFLKTSQPHVKIQIFQEKAKLLIEINNALQKV